VQLFFFFFFQAEDGIRDGHVTGVQTCALPICFTDNSSTISGTITNGVTVTGPDLVNVSANLNSIYAPVTNNFGQTNLVLTISARSEERRVGKECRAGWWPCY